MKAGFALAALLLDDRALALVAPALPSELVPALSAELCESRGQDDGVAALLRVLQPELTAGGVNQLPPRMRSLLARLLPASARKALLAEFGSRADSRASSALSADASAQRLGTRPDFVLDEQLLRVLVRLARRPVAPVPA